MLFMLNNNNPSFPCHKRGAALLVEAANMGDPDAQYELGCRLRVEVRLHMLFIKS